MILDFLQDAVDKMQSKLEELQKEIVEVTEQHQDPCD